ncbi:hypothetical protein LTR95_016583 [Oleoguttula sp. CCFEE 5521]
MPSTATTRSTLMTGKRTRGPTRTPVEADLAVHPIPHIYGTYSGGELVYYITLPAAARDLWRDGEEPTCRSLVRYDDDEISIQHHEAMLSFNDRGRRSASIPTPREPRAGSAAPSALENFKGTATPASSRHLRDRSAESVVIKSEPLNDHDHETEDNMPPSSDSSGSSPEGQEPDDQTSEDFQASSSPMREERSRAASKAGILTIAASERRLLAKDLMKPFLSFGVRDELLAMIHAATRAAKASMYEEFMAEDENEDEDEDESESGRESGSEDERSPMSTVWLSSTPGLLEVRLPRSRQSRTPPRLSPSPDVSRRRRGKYAHFHDACAEPSVSHQQEEKMMVVQDACGENRKRQRV